MHTCFNIQTVLRILVFVCIAVPQTCLGQDENLEHAKDEARSILRRGGFLDSCVSYQGLIPKGGCIDPIGFGARCPTTTITNQNPAQTVENLQISIYRSIRASLGKNGLARLEASDVNEAKLYFKVDNFSTASHDHDSCTDRSATHCDSIYLARIDTIYYRMALYNSKNGSLDLTIPNFGTIEARASADEGFAIQLSAKICGWKRHGPPLNCVPCEGRRRENRPHD
jgi:hypothetical protein